MRQNPFSHCLISTRYPALASTLAQAKVVHVLDIACPVAKLREFMSDAPQWLSWTMPALQTVQPLPFGQWLLKTPRKLLKLRLCPVTGPNELLYEMLVPGVGGCQGLVRMKATPTGCKLSLTLRKHQQLPTHVFTATARHTLNGLQTLKLVLEQD
jgi:hypothetical protein